MKTILLAFAVLAGLAGSESKAQNPKPQQAVSEKRTLPEPINSVYTNYFQIQLALADDSMKGVTNAANAMTKAIREEKTKTFPAPVAQQTEALAKAKNLSEAREAFKPVSVSLIKYLAGQKFNTDSYDEFYCHMADASWLQIAEETKNPYFGKSMPGCGMLKKTY